MNSIIEKLGALGLVPVVTVERLEDALPLAKALCDGGLPAVEVTFRTPCAKEAIAKMVEAYPHMMIGAGTVLTKKQVDDAVEVGAKFVVSPGLNPEIVAYAKKKEILMIPGCMGPSDIERAIALGLDFVKFFPAEAAGGLPMIQAMAAPYTQIKFMPTGGINEKNIDHYLACDKIVACGGSWMANAKMIKQGKFEEITKATVQAVRTMLGLTFLSVHTVGRWEEKSQSSFLSTLIDKEVQSIDINDTKSKGYVTYSTTSLKRVMSYLELIGEASEQVQKTYDEQGKCNEVYLQQKGNALDIQFIQQD